MNLKLEQSDKSLNVNRCTGLGRKVKPENCAILGYYKASSGNFLQMFRGNFSVPSSGFKNPLLAAW